jgi:hypothetical protein
MPRWVQALTFAAAVAFSTPLAAQTSAQMDADTKEIAAYRLTMANVKKFSNAMRAFAEEMKRDPKYQELTKIEEEIEKLSEKEELTDAESERLEKLRERKEALEQEDDDSDMGSAKSLSQMEAAIRKEPRFVAVLQREGLTPREYSKFLLAYLQAAMIVGFSQGKVDFAKLPPEVNAENVKFILEHKAELDALQQEFQALAKKKR